MRYLFREVNLQGGIFFCFVLSSSDRELHSHLVRKCEKRYASCFIQAIPSAFIMLDINPEREVNAPGGTFSFSGK